MSVKKIKMIKSIGKKRVYDIVTVSKNKNFILSNGVVAHNCTSTQPAMRGVIEEFAKNCRFIFTCNYPNKIIDPIHSRCSVIEFRVPKKEMPSICAEMMKRIIGILTDEGIEFDPQVVAAFIKKGFPDFRTVIGDLQNSVINNRIDLASMGVEFDEHFQKLVGALKNGKFNEMEAWINQYASHEPDIFGRLYTFLSDKVKPASKPQLVIHCNDFDYRNAFCSDHVLNLKAALINIMADIEFL
jgi:DNA polymerase III delta prime subunit